MVGAGPGGPVGDWKERTPFVAVDSYAIAFRRWRVLGRAGAGNSMGLTLDARGASSFLFRVRGALHLHSNNAALLLRKSRTHLRSSDDSAE